MSESKHTKGPWIAKKASHGPVDIFDSMGRDVVTVYGGGVGLEFQEANARLIAAAPEMYEALKLALEYWEHRQQRYKNRSPVWVQNARAALAKSEGRT